MDTEVKPLPETKTGLGPKLLFHGTSVHVAEEIMKEHGLMANSPTLTPRLELALDFANGNMLSCWYPQRNEYKPIREGFGATVPTTPLTDDTKDEVVAAIESEHTDQWYKEFIKVIIKNARTVMPATRLGAVIRFQHGTEISFNMYIPSHQKNYLKEYRMKKDEWIAKYRSLLDKCEVHYYSEGLDNQKLAEDIVRTDFEHSLLRIGDRLDRTKKTGGKYTSNYEWRKTMQELQEIEFGDPVYDRYRTMLVSGIERYLHEAA